MFWLLLGCLGPPSPADAESRSHQLALQVEAIGREAAELALKTRRMEAKFDEVRAAPEADQERLRAEAHEGALAIQQEALRLQQRVEQVEVAARVW